MASSHTLSYTPNNLLIEHYTAAVTNSVVRKVLNKIEYIYTPFYKLDLFCLQVILCLQIHQT